MTEITIEDVDYEVNMNFDFFSIFLSIRYRKYSCPVHEFNNLLKIIYRLDGIDLTGKC